MESKLQKYLKGYEMVKASEENKNLVYVPYADHHKISKYLKKNDIQHSLRFNHNYSTAIYCI